MKTLKITCVLIIALLIGGCDTSSWPALPGDIGTVMLDVHYVLDNGKPFPGGQCEDVALVILAVHYKGIIPTAEMVEEERAHRDNHKENIFRYFRNRWGLTARYRRWELIEIHEWLQQGNPMVALIDGWKAKLHAIVIIGLDSDYIYYHDPSLGASRSLSHGDFQRLHVLGQNGVWIIKQHGQT